MDVPMTEKARAELEAYLVERVKRDDAPRPPPLVAPIQPLASVPCFHVCGALAKAQGQFKPIKRTDSATIKGETKAGKDYEYKYKYAPLDKVIDATRPGLSENELAVQQYITFVENVPYVRSVLWHSSGEWMACDYPIYRTKEGHQGFASGTTYARRYGYLLLVCAAAEDEDDDGHGANGDGGPPDNWRDGLTVGSAKKPPPNKPPPKAEKAEPAHDPATGELAAPGEIPAPSDGNWVAWGSVLVATLKAATSAEAMEQWVHENTAQLVRCMQDAPAVHDKVIKRLGELRTKWKQPATEKA